MIDEIYKNVLLSTASYIDYVGNYDHSGNISTDLEADFINSGFTQKQFDDFINRYQIVHHVPDSIWSGFSATAFRDTDNNDQITIAFRGTNNALDAFFDIKAALGIDVNLFMGDQTGSIPTFVADVLSYTGLSSAAGINFAGHSLGGYLATMAAYKYSEFGNAYTFNGLGNSALDSALLILGIGQPDPDTVFNYYAYANGSSEIVSKLKFLDRPGEPDQPIYVEDNGDLENHKIRYLIQSLSVYRLLVLVDPSLDSKDGMDKIHEILSASSSNPDISLETIVSHLGTLLGGNLATAPYQTDIERFYQEVELIFPGQTFSITTIPSDIASLAAADDSDQATGYRYALVNLLPFAITSNLAGTAAADSKYNLDNFTEEYLSDRAYLLANLLSLNIADTDVVKINDEREYFVDYGNSLSFKSDGAYFFEPSVSKQYIFGDDDGNTINGGTKNDRLYGGDGIDVITGGEDNDYLEGGAQNDTLTGGEDNDTLVGGDGDIYIWNVSADKSSLPLTRTAGVCL